MDRKLSKNLCVFAPATNTPFLWLSPPPTDTHAHHHLQTFKTVPVPGPHEPREAGQREHFDKIPQEF